MFDFDVITGPTPGHAPQPERNEAAEPLPPLAPERDAPLSSGAITDRERVK